MLFNIFQILKLNKLNTKNNIGVLIKVGCVPNGHKITKRTGETLYEVIRSISVYGAESAEKVVIVKPKLNSVFLSRGTNTDHILKEKKVIVWFSDFLSAYAFLNEHKFDEDFEYPEEIGVVVNINYIEKNQKCGKISDKGNCYTVKNSVDLNDAKITSVNGIRFLVDDKGNAQAVPSDFNVMVNFKSLDENNECNYINEPGSRAADFIYNIYNIYHGK